MKHIFSIIFVVFFVALFGCKREVITKEAQCPEVQAPDTIKVPVPNQVDIVLRKQVEDLKAENMKLSHAIDSIVIVNDTLAIRLLRSKLMVNNARYYLNICIRNPKQDVFLKGWMKRALTE